MGQHCLQQWLRIEKGMVARGIVCMLFMFVVSCVPLIVCRSLEHQKTTNSIGPSDSMNFVTRVAFRSRPGNTFHEITWLFVFVLLSRSPP